MSNPIVNITVNIIAAPLPNNIQQMGAIISQGATNLAEGTSTVITSPADLAAVTSVKLAITSLTWLAGVVTATTAAPHGIANADVVPLTIGGAAPVAYNGSYEATITGASSFTYPLAANPNTSPATTPGTWISSDVLEINTQLATFFAQGSQQAVYILELGEGSPAQGVAALSTYLTDNPGDFYRFLLPREWGSEPTLLTLIALYESTTSKTYFHVTATLANYTDYTKQMKSAFVFIESPNADPTAEFGAAWPFWVMLHYRPSPTNKVTPLAFSLGVAVTPYPLKGNSALFTTLKAANVNWAGTGAEGGISTTILFWGTTMDGRDGIFWYAVDWAQINIDLNISNAVINGSNDPINPLDYDQNGINRLQGVAAATLSSGVSFGLLTGTVQQTELDGATFDINQANGLYAGKLVVNAIPFPSYVKTNPSDFPEGIYNGFAAIITTARGFITIGFVINVTDFGS